MFLLNLASWLLSRLGKTYKVDQSLPSSLIIAEFSHRTICAFRGLMRIRRFIFMDSGVRIRGGKYLSVGKYSTIERSVCIDAFSRRGVTIKDRVKLGAYTIISSTSHLSTFGSGLIIGNDCGIGAFGFFGAAGFIEIGNNVIMGQYVSFHAQNHEFDDRSLPIQAQGTTAKGIVIEDGVWVGAKVTFLDGSHVGAHSIVAAGTVVRGNFAPYSIIGGVPAKLLRMRDELGDAHVGLAGGSSEVERLRGQGDV